GGMSAVFATPIAAVLLSVELLLFEWRPRSFIPVAAAAAVASMVRIPLMGTGPLFPLSHLPLDWTALIMAAAVGIAAGGCAAVLTALVYACEDGFKRLPVHWMWWPAIGGIAVGLAGLWDPRILGVGYDLIEQLLHGTLTGSNLAVLVVAKAL